MALGSTIYTFDIQLADMDRAVYETLGLRVARHPSETEESLVSRVLVYCLEYTEGIAFSAGVSDTTEPAITVRDLTGGWKSWIEIGTPDAARLHRASKAAPRVAVYTHKHPSSLLKALTGERIHRAEDLELYAMDRPMIAELVARLDRRLKFDLSITERHLYLTLGKDTLTGVIERLSL
jgi:uncharacterized protein YaeQ